MDDATAAMTPEERIAAGLCAECGRDMKGLNPPSHAGEHWPPTIVPDGRNQEAIKRQKLMREMTPIPATAVHKPGEHESVVSPPSSALKR
jgi:hypothetical protein